MTDLPAPGLRERKKQQTRHRLETAAVAIVSEEGMERLTIDSVSERAGVSPRTFFNYFDSKEDAILGLRTEEDTRRFVEAVVGGMPPAPLIDGVLDLLIRVSDSAMFDHELRERRREVVLRHPELLGRHFGHIGRMLDPLTRGVRLLMAREDARQDAATAEDPHAQVILMMCGAALRAAMVELTRAHADLSTDESLALLRTRAAALIRETTGRLS
ncbi:MAG: helix-turn-helix domain-containing protein [Microbacterium sp.]